MKYLMRAFLVFIVIPITLVLAFVVLFLTPITTPFVYVFTGTFEPSYLLRKVFYPLDLLREKVSKLKTIQL
jgi:hypothetical protein